LLSDAYEFFLSKKDFNAISFDVEFLFSVHKYFLSTLYDWAGKTREVDMSKGSMMFASVKHLKESLKYFDKILKENLPRKKDAKNKIASKLAVIHNEYNAIHLFREGNGRTIRLFMDLLLASIGNQTINWKEELEAGYIKACIAGAIGNHQPMTNFILKKLKESWVRERKSLF